MGGGCSACCGQRCHARPRPTRRHDANPSSPRSAPAGWCDGSVVRPWLIDITADVWSGGGPAPAAFNVTYRSTFQGHEPNPAPQTNMPYMIAHSYVSFYDA